MPIVGRASLTSLKTVVAMLSIALSLVFAGATAATVVNQAEHQGEAAAHDGHLAFSDIHFDSHHHEDEAASADDAGSGTQHHHHGDGLVGQPAVSATLASPAPSAVLLLVHRDDLAASLGTQGLERPPKAFTTRA
jgi:hypothetical protein